MRSQVRSFAFAVLPFVAALGAGPASGCATSSEGARASEQASTADDLAVAREVVDLLGGDNGHCNDCHGVTAVKVRAWGTAMKDIETNCLAPGLTAVERVNCLRSVPTSPSSPFSPKRLGLYAAGVSQDTFKTVFDEAFPGSTAEYASFKQRTAMPRSGTPLTPAELEEVKGWVLRGMPQLDEAFGGTTDAGTDVDVASDGAPRTAAE